MAGAVLAAIVLTVLLPDDLRLGPRWLLPVVEAVLLVLVVVGDPGRIDRRTRALRFMSIALVAVLVTGALAATVQLVDELIEGGSVTNSPSALLAAGATVWSANAIAFALLYWELDRGGPVARVSLPREKIPLADFRFTQDETKDTVAEVAAGSSQRADWIPLFVDYLYLSTTNSSAFSPTDTMPLSTRAKMLMGVQATAALFTSLLVIARAVGSLGGGG
jgi:hypothetical protein